MINLLSGPLYKGMERYTYACGMTICNGTQIYDSFYDTPFVRACLDTVELNLWWILWDTIRCAVRPVEPFAHKLRHFMMDFMIPAAGLDTVELDLWWILWYAFCCTLSTVHGEGMSCWFHDTPVVGLAAMKLQFMMDFMIHHSLCPTPCWTLCPEAPELYDWFYDTCCLPWRSRA